MTEIQIQSHSREEMIDITSSAAAILKSINKTDGALLIFCPHTTCGLTINEGADPDVQRDLIKFFREAAPFKNNWAHIEGNSDAHIRASLLGASLLVPVQTGELKLGRWQAIYLYEGDGPRLRSLWLQMLPGQKPSYKMSQNQSGI